jgi:hypothetical protein
VTRDKAGFEHLRGQACVAVHNLTVLSAQIGRICGCDDDRYQARVDAVVGRSDPDADTCRLMGTAWHQSLDIEFTW